jgi:hypothetical protein
MKSDGKRARGDRKSETSSGEGPSLVTLEGIPMKIGWALPRPSRKELSVTPVYVKAERALGKCGLCFQKLC